MMALLTFLFSVKVAFCSCRPEVRHSGFQRSRSEYRIERTGRLPRFVNESSGLVFLPRPDGSGTFLTHNDSGGQPTLYEIRPDGTFVDSLRLPGTTNVDWEALTLRDTSTVFLGDIGNNANIRQELSIYRVNRRRPQQAEILRFRYVDQQAFPPPKDTRNFDSEALFQAGDSLFLLTKNRSRRPVRLYGMPVRPGQYALTPLDSIFLKSMVTDAALSPDGKRLAVLTYGKIFLFDLTSGAPLLSQPRECIRLPRGQTEGISFVNNTDLAMTNERGRLFLIIRKKY